MTLVLGSVVLIYVELTFIIENLTLLCFSQPPELAYGLAYAMGRAHLIENSMRVVKVGIDGPREILVVSLCSHQPDIRSRTRFKLNL